jgi:hypothetical protein|tara:strand:- start:137 stop:406 length:270 start_codon:yes stop_codon:yes gene_type:complete
MVWNEAAKLYKKTPNGKRNNTIADWKIKGVISHDFLELHKYYINTFNCENCDQELIGGRGLSNHRHLDHSHETGIFRQVLCGSCNILRN